MAPATHVLVLSVVALLLPHKPADAFTQYRPALVGRRSRNAIMSMSTNLFSDGMERRAFVKELTSGAAFGAVAVGLTVERAGAYEKEYLTETTAEFKAIEARQSEFAAAQRAYKKEFVKILDAFLAANTDDEIIINLNSMSNTVIQRGGLPESLRINDLLKTCRRKKAEMKDLGKWGTPAQIAYETLVQTTNKTVVPLQSGS